MDGDTQHVDKLWRFETFEALAGEIRWYWVVSDLSGEAAACSVTSFGTFTECLEHAQLMGYREPPER